MVNLNWRLALLLVMLVSGPTTAGATVSLRVAAASNLRYAMQVLGQRFSRTNPEVQVVAVYGSSGRLYRQILHGAPFDLFFSADVAHVERLHQAGKGEGLPKVYARGRLVLWSRDQLPGGGSLAALGVTTGRLVLANPEHAPYGRAARQALEKAGVWSRIRSRLIYAENIAQAAQYAQGGAASFALLAQSLIKTPEFPRGHARLVDEGLYDPLIQSALVLRGDNPSAARRFLTFVLSEEGQAVLREFGFGSTGERP
jgi:molybdate transport system substrate-binding protein